MRWYSASLHSRLKARVHPAFASGMQKPTPFGVGFLLDVVPPGLPYDLFDFTLFYLILLQA